MEGLKELRGDLIDFCKARALKGTILLAPEGINLFVAGEGAAVEELLEKLRSLPGLADLMGTKESMIEGTEGFHEMKAPDFKT